MSRHTDNHSYSSVLVLGVCLAALLGWKAADLIADLWAVIP